MKTTIGSVLVGQSVKQHCTEYVARADKGQVRFHGICGYGRQTQASSCRSPNL